MNTQTPTAEHKAALDQQLAQLMHRCEPTRDLWPGIQAKLEPRAAASDAPTPKPRVSRRRPRRLALAAAASVAVVALAVTTAWHQHRAGQQPILTATAPAAELNRDPAWRSVMVSFDAAEQEIRSLNGPFGQNLESRELDFELRMLEAESARLRDALRADPHNVTLIQSLVDLERQRLTRINEFARQQRITASNPGALSTSLPQAAHPGF